MVPARVEEKNIVCDKTTVINKTVVLIFTFVEK